MDLSGKEDGECQLVVKSEQTHRSGEPSTEISSIEPTYPRTDVDALPEHPTSNGHGQTNREAGQPPVMSQAAFVAQRTNDDTAIGHPTSVRTRKRPKPTTIICTMPAKGGGQCGRNLTADEIGKWTRCKACRAMATAVKRQSNHNIAQGRGKRKHAQEAQRLQRAKVNNIQQYYFHAVDTS